MSVDLSFGSADNNLYLLGPETNGQFTGRWSYTTLKESRPEGCIHPAGRPLIKHKIIRDALTAVSG